MYLSQAGIFTPLGTNLHTLTHLHCLLFSLANTASVMMTLSFQESEIWLLERTGDPTLQGMAVGSQCMFNCCRRVRKEQGDPDSSPSSLTKLRYLLTGHICLESNIRTLCDLHGSFRKGNDLSSVCMPMFCLIHHSAHLAMSPSKQEWLP